MKWKVKQKLLRSPPILREWTTTSHLKSLNYYLSPQIIELLPLTSNHWTTTSHLKSLNTKRPRYTSLEILVLGFEQAQHIHFYFEQAQHIHFYFEQAQHIHFCFEQAQHIHFCFEQAQHIHFYFENKISLRKAYYCETVLIDWISMYWHVLILFYFLFCIFVIFGNNSSVVGIQRTSWSLKILLFFSFHWYFVYHTSDSVCYFVFISDNRVHGILEKSWIFIL
jgi:hypothetical protein